MMKPSSGVHTYESLGYINVSRTLLTNRAAIDIEIDWERKDTLNYENLKLLKLQNLNFKNLKFHPVYTISRCRFRSLSLLLSLYTNIIEHVLLMRCDMTIYEWATLKCFFMWNVKVTVMNFDCFLVMDNYCGHFYLRVHSSVHPLLMNWFYCILESRMYKQTNFIDWLLALQYKEWENSFNWFNEKCLIKTIK